MDVQPVFDRLKAKTTCFRLLEQAGALEEAMQSNRGTTPAGYVVPMSERGSEMRHTGAVDQELTQVIAVIQVVQPAAMRLPHGLVECRRQVKAALVGWEPDEELGEPVLFLGGELVELKPGQLWWADEFFVTSYYRSTP
jgi:hypothetical protein